MDDVADTVGKTKKSVNDGVTTKGMDKYQVGAYKDIKGVEGLDAHHAGQKAAMKKLVDNYDLNTALQLMFQRWGTPLKDLME